MMRKGGWKAVWGCTYESLALFRISLGSFLVLELVLRYRFLRPFYSNQGTLPLHVLVDKVDDLYQAVCLHCHLGELWHQQVLLTVQVLLAVLLTVGYKTRWTSLLSWYLYFSLKLRNTWLNYILDRYFHFLLFLSMFLPLDKCWAVSTSASSPQPPPRRRRRIMVISPATIAIKLLVLWIYLDAGWGKYSDPLQGWTYGADPLPALDTYARHTLVARYLYALIGPAGLRLLTPVVVYVELFVAPLSLVASYLGLSTLVYAAVGVIWSLHIGIALTLNNSAMLSLVACVAWCPLLPIGWERLDHAVAADAVRSAGDETNPAVAPRRPTTPASWTDTAAGNVVSMVFILAMAAGNIWLETVSNACDQSVQHIWSSLLHNRWNVFIGAEEYVTWEIAPGRLKDGSVVDIWTRNDEVNWSLPGGGGPSSSSARPGRWRSFPYLAELDRAESDALWGYLCSEWNSLHDIDRFPGKELVKFNFFMLQADVLPNMAFSETRKRLVHSHECIWSEEEVDQSTETTVGDNSGPAHHEEL